jgi:hypothetical protein
METTIQSTAVHGTYQTVSKSASRSAFWESMEFNRFGIIAILLLIIGCTGGIAVAFGAGADILQISMVAFPTIIALALILAVSPMKTIAWVSFVAIVIDLLVLAI